MQFIPFSISRLPRISYGSGRINEVPALAAVYGHTALLVTGKQSFCATPRWQSFTQSLNTMSMRWLHFTVSGEPSPMLVDQAVSQFRGEAVDVVIGIGGGSVLDAAKAIAGLLPHGNSVMDHLEGSARTSLIAALAPLLSQFPPQQGLAARRPKTLC
jgi:alcohol dehydrogenase